MKNNIIFIASVLVTIVFIAGCTSLPATPTPGNDSTAAPPAQPPVISAVPPANTTQTATNLTESGAGLSEPDITIDQPAEENTPFDEPPAF